MKIMSILKSIVHGSSILSFVVIVCPVFIVFISANTAVKDLLFRFLVTSNDPSPVFLVFIPGNTAVKDLLLKFLVTTNGPELPKLPYGLELFSPNS